MINLVAKLPDVTDAQRARILTAPKTSEAHAALLREIPAMTSLQVGGTGSAPQLPHVVNVAAWNVERCLFPKESAEMLRPHGPHVVLLSEMDSGMARTAQRDTTADVAEALGMHYAYGVEFYEMDLGGAAERVFCRDDFNAHGWHGNAILSSARFEALALIRLDRTGHWFAETGAVDPKQPRIGGRIAVAGIIPSIGGPMCFVSTHLESNADAAHRHLEFDRLLTELEAFCGDMPILIGGDLNTGNHIPPDYNWQDETLFDLARHRGFRWSLTPDGTTTRPSRITPHPIRERKLDWFCHRGMHGEAGVILPALAPDKSPLSDHECIFAQVTAAKD